MKDWKWVKSKEGSFLQTDILNNHNFVHSFFTREWNNKGPNQLAATLNNCNSVYSVKQVHSNKVITTSTKIDSSQIEADGILTNRKGQSLWVCTADCIPILFADPEKRHVAACHAGWRGIASGIIMNILNKFEHYGTNREKLLVALGPAISKANYQVNQDVGVLIHKSINIFGKEHNIPNKDRISELISLGIVTEESLGGKIKLDIRRSAVTQLDRSGISKNHLTICPLCTYSEPKLFHSWRREKKKKVQWSAIVS